MTDEYGKVHTDGSRSGGQPVVAQQKALAVANNLLGIDCATLGELSHQELMMALVHIVQQSEAFKQEVSDTVEEYIECFSPPTWHRLNRFIIPKPKPDPLVEVIAGWTGGTVLLASDLRAALDAAGFEIREKGQ